MIDELYSTLARRFRPNDVAQILLESLKPELTVAEALGALSLCSVTAHVSTVSCIQKCGVTLICWLTTNWSPRQTEIFEPRLLVGCRSLRSY